MVLKDAAIAELFIGDVDLDSISVLIDLFPFLQSGWFYMSEPYVVSQMLMIDEIAAKMAVLDIHALSLLRMPQLHHLLETDAPLLAHVFDLMLAGDNRQFQTESMLNDYQEIESNDIGGDQENESNIDMESCDDRQKAK